MYCELCGAEIRWPDEPSEVYTDTGDTLILCPDCELLEYVDYQDE